MKVLSKTLGATLLMSLVALSSGSVLAQRQYSGSDTNVRNLIQRIETRTDGFSRNFSNALDRSRLNGTARADEANRLITDFQDATDQLKNRFESRQSTSADVRAVLDRAALINQFLNNNRLDVNVEQDWRLLQSDLDQLARIYYINDWRWTTSGVGTGVGYGTGYGNSNLTNAQMRQLISRIQNRTALFSRSFNNELSRARFNTMDRDEARRHLVDFQAATTRLNVRNVNQNTSDVEATLEHGSYLNSFVSNNRLSNRVQDDWSLLKSELDQLASAYNMTSWTSSPTPGTTYGGYGSSRQLTGTYRLNTAQSGNARAAAESATRNLPAAERQRVFDSLVRRLDPPDVLAIDRQGTSITIASSRAPQINFVADGREQVETNANGRTVRVRATLIGEQLEIARTGDRAQDFTVTFAPADNGRRLLVTRRLYTDQLNQAVTVQSYYDRTSDVAQLDLYNGSPDYSNTGAVTGDYAIADGTEIIATLNSNLSTETAHDNDRFTMTVTSPNQYQGATIEGYVTNANRSGRITGRSEMTLNFDTIRMRDGRSYRYAGILQAIRTPSGEVVRVDNEGAVRDSDQTNKTVTRAAIGTAVGALIGAIAGGGKGAAQPACTA